MTAMRSILTIAVFCPGCRRPLLCRVMTLVAMVCMLGFSAPTLCQTHNSRPVPIRLQPRVDIPVVIGAGAIWLLPSLFTGTDSSNRCTPACDPGSINSLDRTVVGNQSTAARTAADTMLVGIPLAAGIGSFMSLVPFGPRGVVADLVLIAQAATLTGALTTVFKQTVKRPRPYMYDPDTPANYTHGDQRDYRSFFSGHTATAFSVSIAFATIFRIRYPDHPGEWLIWTLAIGTATGTGLLRVRSGDHFWTDSLTGGLVGTILGIGVPMLHRQRSGPKKHRISLMPAVSPVGAGISGTF